MRLVYLLFIFLMTPDLFAQFAPAAGYPGTDAIPADSSCFVNWANRCAVTRGYINILDTSLGKVSTGDDLYGTGRALDNPTVSLGDGGFAVLEFPVPIINGPGPDLAVFENAFLDSFLELATVSVSSDGVLYYTFPAICHTDTLAQLGSFGLSDAAKLYNLAGKHRAGYGVPFDLAQLKGLPGLDINAITHVKVQDVVGILNSSWGSRDSEGRLINDPWPTPFPSGGFDLDAVGVIWDQLHNGLSGALSQTFYASPNPSHQFIWLSGPAPESDFELKDLRGNTILKLQTGMNNVAEVPSGVYIICSDQSYFKIVIHH